MTMLASTVYATTDTPLGNGAFTAAGRLVVSHHPMYETPVRVSVFNDDGSLSAFPNVAWNTPEGDPSTWLDAVLGLHDDTQGRIWLADMGTRSNVPAKFVVWDTVADRLDRVIPIPPEVLTPYSEPNDFAVDLARGKVYIADEGAGHGGDGSRAGLIVVDLATGMAVRRLEGHNGIRAERRNLVIDGATVRHRGDGSDAVMRVGVDGIALDAAGEWLYLSPLNGHTLWRLRVDDLLDAGLDDTALAKRLERFATKPNSGGMAFDDAGNLYLTVIETNAVGRVTPDGRYDAPVVRDDMFWPDGLMKGPDGAMYVVCTQLPRSPALARPGERPVLPFKVFRFDPRVPTAPTRLSGGDVVRGALAGIAGSLAVNAFQAIWRRVGLPVPAGDPPPPEATEVLADRIARRVFGRPLGPAATVAAGTAVHLAVGVGLGVAYAGLRRRWPAVTAGRGVAYGLGVWATVEECGLAAIDIKPPPWRVGPAEHAFSGGSHVAFGAVLDATFRALSPKS